MMITWKNKKYIIFGLNGILINQALDSNDFIKLANNAEKLLFKLLNHYPQIRLTLASNDAQKDLERKMESVGLDCLISNSCSSLSYGLTKQNEEFWYQYLAERKIKSCEAVVIDHNLNVALAAVKANLEVVLITDNTNVKQRLDQKSDQELEDSLIKHKRNICFVHNLEELLNKISSTIETTLAETADV